MIYIYAIRIDFKSVSRLNYGPAATRNYGIDNTAGEWLVFLDSDDELEHNALDIFRKSIKDYSYAKMIVGGHASVDKSGESHYRGVKASKNNVKSSEELFKGYLLNKTVTPSNGATAMHRDIFNNRRFPEAFRNSEDIPIFAFAFANFPCAFVEESINKVYKHKDSLRHNIIYAYQVGTGLVNVVFDERYLPDHLQKHRKAYSARRLLSLFRTFYLAGEKQISRNYFLGALSSDWRVIFKISYCLKALKCFFPN